MTYKLKFLVLGAYICIFVSLNHKTPASNCSFAFPFPQWLQANAIELLSTFLVGTIILVILGHSGPIWLLSFDVVAELDNPVVHFTRFHPNRTRSQVSEIVDELTLKLLVLRTCLGPADRLNKFLSCDAVFLLEASMSICLISMNPRLDP